MTEATSASVSFVKFIDNPELNLFHGHEYHLRDAFGGLDFVTF